MRHGLAIVIAGVIALISPAMSFAAPAAGTVIGNQATATYNDSGGTARTTTSNLVQTTVTQVKTFTLTANGSRTAAPGQTVYYPHTITNTGNGTDTYTLNAPLSTSFGAGPHTALAYYIDANGDGVPDNSTPVTATGPIAAGGTFRFVVAGTVPAGATSGNTAQITVSVSDTNPTTSTNTDTTTVANSVISVTKAMSLTSGPSPQGPITITLSYFNTGSAAATNVQLTDTLPATLTYVPNSGRWSAAGVTPLTDANDGVEQSVSFPPGIDYRSSLGAGATIVAILPTVPAGTSANVTFQVNVNANLAPQTINNTAQYQTSTQLSTNTNTASYQVLQGASVVANGSNSNSTNGVGEPVTIAAAAAGSTITFSDYVWNKGNGSDTFDITVPANTFPAGSTVTLLQQDGATTLINSGGGPAPDTGPVPGAGQACPAPLVSDTTVSPNICGYKVVVRVTLPPSVAPASYSLTLRATSSFNNTISDDVIDTLASVPANTVDVTNDKAAPPAGTAIASDGAGASGTTIIRTNTVTPGAAATPSRFRVWVTNTGLVAYDFGLTSTLAASTAVGVVPPALPPGWVVAFKADASGAAADCSTVGAVVTNTGPLAPGAAKLVCAEITVPALASNTAYAGNYDFDFTATSTTNASVIDAIRDRVTVNLIRNITFVADSSATIFPNGSFTYTHTLTNLGNSLDSVNFAGGCLSDSRSANGWTSAAYVDANANGTLETGTDTPIVCGSTSVVLSPGEARSVFVRVTAPATALPSDPANVTTLSGVYASSIAVHDSTSITAGLTITKEQQAVGAAGCSVNNAPAGSYSAAAIPAGATTAPGSCIAYRITATNTTAAPMTAVTIADPIPASVRMQYSCSGNGSSTPLVTVGSIAGTTPADGANGTVTANVGTLAPGQSAVLYFCALIPSGTVIGTVIPNAANVTATQSGNTTNLPSNTATVVSGSPPGTKFAGFLAVGTTVNVDPGQRVLIPHTLTNLGTATDNFTITAVDAGGAFTFTGIALYPDANGDGVADSNVPIVQPITLNAGQVFHFVLGATVPTSPQGNSGSIHLGATSAGGAIVNGLNDFAILRATAPPDCAQVWKSLSRDHGTSPGGALTVTLQYNACDTARAKLLLVDALPAGMNYIAGSARWTGTGNTPLTDGITPGGDRQGTSPSQVSYDFGQSAPGTVTANIYSLPAGATGAITFQVTIASGIATNTFITNNAYYIFSDASGFAGNRQNVSATYLVTGVANLTLVGQRLPAADPGTTVTFTNVLTNKGTVADTYDITLAASTFPAGAAIHFFKSDGVTPLADTDGDGIPDTGPVAAGASYNIVVKVDIPATTLPGPYKLSKTATSALMPAMSVTVDDSIDALAQKCFVSLTPDNQALIGFGQHVTYTHFLANNGNCTEPVTAMLNYLGDSAPGWTSAAYIDNPTAGGGSIPGVVDPTDTPITQGWTQRLNPGDRLRVLVDVHAPNADAAKSLAKSIVLSDVTTLTITSATVGALIVRDTTNVDGGDIPPQPANSIRNFTDSTYSTPTVWGVIGRSLYLQANAAACNADPNTAETRTVILTGSNGDRETVTAVETGPNTGIFVVSAIPVHAPPVVVADGIVEGNPNDVFTVDMQGCGQPISTVVTLTGNGGVVFDSRTNATIPGATVTLVGASGGTCSTTPAPVTNGGHNPVVTGSDGRYEFSAAAGDYCLAIAPPNGYHAPSTVPYTQLPSGRNLNVTGLTAGGSYGNPFHVGADGLVVVDVPLDTTAQTGLFVQKDSSKTTAEMGDFVDYTVGIRNGTGNALNLADVILTDNLPAGFAYVKGTARRDGTPIADPKGGGGPALSFTLGHMDQGLQTTLTYRVRLGPGSTKGDGTNRAQAFYTVNGATTASNVAMARVQVTGGVFSDQGFILGKVYLDCNANGLQDAGEEGLSGVRVLLEDGTYAITDGGGKYSFYGITNHTHVIKVDRTTLPAGARLETISNRNLGDPNSRIIDLKSGELARGDFAVEGCEAPVLEEAKARRAMQAHGDELSALAGAQLTTEARVITDPKALPASGTIELAAAAPMPGAAAAAGSPVVANAGYTSLAPVSKIGETLPTPAPKIEKFPETAPPLAPLEKIILAAPDNTLAFMDLTDGQVVSYAQANIRVKGVAGTTFKLTVNGDAVPEGRVGKRSTLADKELQAWEFVGVELRSGENTLSVTQIDSFGNERGNATIRITAPGRLGKLVIEVPAKGGIADGKTPVKVAIRLVDDHGVPVTVRTPVTLEASKGRWLVEDMDPKQPGLQVFVENGRGEFELAPPLEPGESMVYAKSGELKAQARLDFLPDLRDMVATGVLEGVINARNLNTRALQPATQSDAFDAELRQISRDWNGGKTDAGVRAAFYLKGKILGEYLLTAAYDSDKDTQQRLFRDIQPDEFYPVYGDSATRGFDAQSTSKLYVRVDKNRSYLLWGDFNTSSTSEVRKLTNYTRSLTGVREHYENSTVSVNAFASRDTTRQVIEELPANGTSGPFQLSVTNPLVNSETVEIVTRDRNQPAIIISSVPQARFVDYEMEPLTGRILFKGPVPSVDSNLNPNSVRVTYEVDQGGPEFWVMGADAQVKVTDRIEVGGVYVKDKNPLQPFTLAGGNIVVKLGEKTYVITEVAQTTSSIAGVDDLKGNAGRIELKHESKDLKADIYIAKTDPNFNNPGSYLTQGRSESGGKIDYKLSDQATIHAEALRTGDDVAHSVRTGAEVTLQYHFAEKLTFEIGMRHTQESGDVSPVPATPGQPTPAPLPDEVTTVRARLTGQVPQIKGLSLYGEAEVDVNHPEDKVIAAGGEYELPNKSRIYARHDFISSITGPYGLNPTEQQNTTAIGIDTEYMKDGRFYSEYRIRDAMSGGDTEAALGLKNLWSIAPGLKLGTTFERVHTLAGTNTNENTAIALALEYTASENWKGSTRLELRDGTTQDSLLFTVGLAAKMNRDWTMLARNAYTLTKNDTGGGEQVIDRMQAGLAYRDNETNRWNALARIEYRVQNDDTQPGVDLKSSTTIISAHADYQYSRPFLVTGRYAAKWTTDGSNGLSTKYHAQVVGARANWEFAPKWDVSLVTSAVFGEQTSSRQYGVGLEVGYLMATNLWLSAGYNIVGYSDSDLAGADYTTRGPFVRLRYKFDESVIEAVPGVKSLTTDGPAPVKPASDGGAK